MKRILFVLAFALVSSLAHAQTPIVIGPATVLNWDMPGSTLAIAQACSYNISVTGSPFVPVIGAVTCTAPAAPSTVPNCSVNLMAQATIPIGAGSIAMTATCSGTTSLPSTPFAYLDVVVPIPANVRFR